MSDLIRRQDVIDMLQSEPHNEPRYPDWWVRKVMVIKPKRGKWVGVGAFCSVCGKEAITEWNEIGGTLVLTPFCPYCGAYMGGDTDED